MAMTTSSKSVSLTPKMLADVQFGTQKYTLTLTGTNQALLGKATLTNEGPALQLNGGWVSLDANQVVRYNTGKVPPATSMVITSTSIPGEIDAGSVVVPLESTTLTVLALSDGLVVDSNTIDTKGFKWVIGQQTLRPKDDGIVVEQAFKTAFYGYRLITITSGSIPTAAASSTITSPPKPAGNLPPATPETTFSSTGNAGASMSAFVSSGMAETAAAAAAITTTSSKASSLRGMKTSLVLIISLLVGLLAA